MEKLLVNTPELARDFLEMPALIYQHFPNYIRPLDQDIQDVFDPKKNKLLVQGTCERWLYRNEAGVYVARIAVFVHPKYKQEQPTGGIGFFECIDDVTLAKQMFDEAKTWLAAQGMEAMDGPINLGERDRWWGLLVDGFDAPLYGMNYHPPYYRKLFESYGFEVYFHQICYGMQVTQSMSDKMRRLHDHYAAQKDFTLEHIRKNQLEKYARDFCTVYNKAWARHGGGKTLDIRQAVIMFKKMKPVMDEEITWFLYHQNEPIAMWINLPDLNQYFRHFKGKLGWWQKLRFVWMRLRGECKRFVGLVYGVVPEWQGKGADAYMIVACADWARNSKKYTHFEMQWIGDFNPKMMNLAHNLGASEVRRLSTYRYLFNRQIPFRRHPAV